MADKNKTIYYSDELNDDFASLGIKKKPLGDDFEYIHKNILWNTCSFVIYRMIAQPLVFVFVKVAHRQRFKNRKVLKTARKTGAFIYANHTNMLLDAFVPNIVKLRKRGYILVGPDTTSIPGLKNIVEMVGAIPLGQTLSENKEMLECINHRIAKNKGFITMRPIRIINVIAPMARKKDCDKSSNTDAPEFAAIRGSNTMVGMTAKSCNSKIPTVARPAGVCISPRPCIKRKATAVDDMAKATPMIIASLTLLCNR